MTVSVDPSEKTVLDPFVIPSVSHPVDAVILIPEGSIVSPPPTESVSVPSATVSLKSNDLVLSVHSAVVSEAATVNDHWVLFVLFPTTIFSDVVPRVPVMVCVPSLLPALAKETEGEVTVSPDPS